MPEKEMFHDKYFKQGMGLISGLPLPMDCNGEVHEKVFARCTFHPNCSSVIFVNCEFIDCEGDDLLRKVNRMAECCSWSNLCEGHRAKLAPELLTMIDAVPTEAEKRRVVNDYIGAALKRGEFTL